MKYKTLFGTSLKKLFSTYPKILFNIHAVEPNNKDLTDIESVRSTAGSDVYEELFKANIADKILMYKIHNLNHIDGFEQMSNTVLLPGHLPFGNNCFSEIYEDDFILELYEFIQNNNNLIDLTNVIQNLSKTLYYLCKDKPLSQINYIIAKYIKLFDNTIMDLQIITIIFRKAISKNSNNNITHAARREQMKDIFSKTNDYLKENTKDVIGILNNVFTFPINNKIIYAPSSMMEHSIILNRQELKNSCISIDGKNYPVIGTNKQLGELGQQGLRQFIRPIMIYLLKLKDIILDVKDDGIIFLVLAINMLINVSPDISDELKNVWKYICIVMLGKKRLICNDSNKIQITELEYLCEGNLPIPNSGKINDFYLYMIYCCKYLDIPDTTDPFILWYALCKSISDDELLIKQSLHCLDKINQVYGKIPDNLEYILLESTKKISLIIIEPSTQFNYFCTVVLEDTSSLGGWIVNPHHTSTGSNCSPNIVFSNNGYDKMLSRNMLNCPWCLKKCTFYNVGPKIELPVIFTDEDIYPFIDSNSNKGLGKGYSKYNTLPNEPTILNSNQKKILFQAKGPVGAGKTTIFTRIKEEIIKMGGDCYMEGTDKYCNSGMHIKNAITNVSNQLDKAFKSTNNLVVVIIDTCGENPSSLVFGKNFNNWTRFDIAVNLFEDNKIKEYLSWSLYNVLNRSKHSYLTPYYLEHISASVSKCVEIHTKKSQYLFGNKFIKVTNKSKLNEIIDDIKNDYEYYQKYLDENHPIEKSISDILNLI